MSTKVKFKQTKPNLIKSNKTQLLSGATKRKQIPSNQFKLIYCVNNNTKLNQFRLDNLIQSM